MSFHDVHQPLSEWAVSGARCAVATLIGVRRSAPRPPGARFAISDRGDMAGSVSSGCVEADLREHMLQVLGEGRPRVVEYGITDEMAHSVGLACGGEIEVLIAGHEPDDAAWQRLADLVGTRTAAVLCTPLGDPGSRLLVEGDGRRTGSLGSAETDNEVSGEIEGLLAHGGSRILEPSGETGRVFAEAFLPAPRVALVGATPVSAALCRIAALTGFEVSLIEPRVGLIRPGWFGDAAEVVHEWPESGLGAVGLDPYVSVVALAHEERLDVPALAAALREGCSYVGLLGGRRTQDARAEALTGLGFGQADIDRIHGPTGLDIGAKTPEEIAVSILAEIIGVRYGTVV